jgi:hypothetical protein
MPETIVLRQELSGLQQLLSRSSIELVLVTWFRLGTSLGARSQCLDNQLCGILRERDVRTSDVRRSRRSSS